MNIHFKTAIDSIRRSPFQALAAVFVLSLTFFVATLVSILAYSSSQLVKYFETRPQIIAFLKDDALENTIASLSARLSADSRVKEVRYISKEEALAIYKKATSDNALLGELVSPAIFPASLEFSVKDISFTQDLINEIRKEPIIDSVGFTAALGGEESLQDVINRLRRITTYVRLGGLAFTGILTAASFMIILIIISMRLVQRREEIEVLSLIGATRKFIQKPITIESLIYAVSGVLIGWVIAFTMVLYLAPSILVYFGDIPVLPRDTIKLLTIFGIIVGAELIFGIFLSLTGSILAIYRTKKK